MRGMLVVCIALLATLGLQACTDKNGVSAGRPSAGNQPAQAPEQARQATAGTAPTSEPATAETNTVPLLPQDIPSETDDGQESVDPAMSGLQPMFKLGGTPPIAVTSARFKEGTHYQKIVPAQPTSVTPDKVEVLEVFWYGCGNCFALDPALDSWRAKSKPAYVDFVRLPAMGDEAQRLQARVFYTAEMLGKLEELHALIFREINVKRNPFDSVEKIGAFFREHGVSTDDFQQTFSSVAVEGKLQRADFLNRRLRIQSAPLLVINGKYRTSVEMAGGEQPLFALIAEIADHEHGG
jgi:protein dithiol oxidoreductase (disulfide-forming)